MKSNFPQQQIDFFPYGKFRNALQDSINDGSFYFALLVSFSFLILIILCYVYKAHLYKKQGYLKVEKNQLRYLFRDPQTSKNKRGGQHRKRLLSLMTDDYDEEYQQELRVYQNKIKSQNNQKKVVQSQKPKINGQKSFRDSLKKPLSQNGRVSLSSKDEVTIHEQQQPEEDLQLQNQENILKINVDLQAKSQDYQLTKSGPFFNDQQSQVVTALASPTRNSSEKQQMLFRQQSNLDQNNQADHNFKSIGNSFSSAPRSHRYQSTSDTTSITPQSINCSQIQPQSVNQKLVDSFTNIVIIQEQSNPNKGFSNFKENKNNYQQNPQQESVQSNRKESNLFTIQKIKSPTGETEKAVKKNQDFIVALEKEMEKQEENALDLSFHKIADSKQSSFCQRLSKNWKRTFQSHSILFNTFKEDMIIFPRYLKVLLICLFINLKIFAGSFIQIYFFNKEVERLQYKYLYRSDHIMHLEKILPKEDFTSVTYEIALNAGVTFILTLLIGILSYAAKAEKDIIFINYNNQQLLNNIKVIQDIQSYKLFVGLIVSFTLGSFTFLQYISVIQLINLEFVKRWLTIDTIIFLVYFCLFDLIYLTFLSLIKAASKTSARCHIMHRYLLKKLSWWSV